MSIVPLQKEAENVKSKLLFVSDTMLNPVFGMRYGELPSANWPRSRDMNLAIKKLELPQCMERVGTLTRSANASTPWLIAGNRSIEIPRGSISPRNYNIDGILIPRGETLAFIDARVPLVIIHDDAKNYMIAFAADEYSLFDNIQVETDRKEHHEFKPCNIVYCALRALYDWDVGPGSLNISILSTQEYYTYQICEKPKLGNYNELLWQYICKYHPTAIINAEDKIINLQDIVLRKISNCKYYKREVTQYIIKSNSVTRPLLLLHNRL